MSETPICKKHSITKSFHKSVQAFRCNRCMNERTREWIARNPEKYKGMHRKSNLKIYYGLTVEEYNTLLEQQNSCCAICGVHCDSQKKKLHVDHDHESGQIRGLLCSHCNLALGTFRDNPEIFKRFVDYLTRAFAKKSVV